MKKRKNFLKSQLIPYPIEDYLASPYYPNRNPEKKLEKEFITLWQAFDRMQNIKSQKLQLEDYIKARKERIGKKENTDLDQEKIHMNWSIVDIIPENQETNILSYQPELHLPISITSGKLSEIINIPNFLNACLKMVNAELKKATKAFETLYANKNG